MTVLVAYDGSEPAQKAAKRAFTEHADEEIILLRVVEAADGYTEAGIELVREYFADRKRNASDKLAKMATKLPGSEDIDYRTEIAVGDPANEIVRFAEANDVDHIIVGNHGRSGVSRVLLGSVAEKVVRRSPVPVTIVR